MAQEIPQILRELPPQKFRELIETLLGGPLKRQSSGSRKEVVENPTDEQLRLPHSRLMGNKIMIHHRQQELHFETDWLLPGEVSDFANSVAQVTYLGAMADGRFQMEDGTEVPCADRWAEIVAEEEGAPASPWPEGSEAVREDEVESVYWGAAVAERVEWRSSPLREVVRTPTKPK